MVTESWKLILAWYLLSAAMACDADVHTPPAASASGAQALPDGVRASAKGERAPLPLSAPASETSVARGSVSTSAVAVASVGPIARMKARAATHPTEYLSKPIKVDGVYVRTTTRTHGGGEHPLYRFIVVMIADAPEAAAVLACEMSSWMPPSDLNAGDPVTIEGHGSAMAGLASGYDLIVGACRVTKR